jgi:diguanylate cyclase (GGDEF)-like protein
VVDCDRVGVYLWHSDSNQLVRAATTEAGSASQPDVTEWSRAPSPGGPLEDLLNNPRAEPIFIDDHSGHPVLREMAAGIGAAASILVPLVAPDQFLGLVAVSVMTTASRLEPSPDLLDRLSGVAAQATTALQNGRLVDQITHQAMHDELTGLANRSQLAEQLRRAVSSAHHDGTEVTLFYLDLDRFKPVNDELGHGAGDELLAAVGGRLRRCTRGTDVVARLGGDEFAVLIAPHTPAHEIATIARRLADAFAAPFAIAGHQRTVHVSSGHAVFPNDAADAESLLGAADAAMFAAKRAGRGAPPRT